MTEIKYTLVDELGLHARPAGQIVKAVAAYQCDVQIGRADKMVNAKRVMGVMGLALKQGEELIMTFDGPGEAEAAAEIEAFLKENV